MNKNIKNSLLSFSAAIALIGCSTSDDYKASNNETKEPIKGEIGLRGKVLSDKYIQNASVCFDSNQNGLCDANETIEKTNENGEFSFEKVVAEENKNSILLALVKDGDKDYVLSSNYDSIDNQIISPFTTLVVNEQFYNPIVESNINSAITYLENNVNKLNSELLKGSDYSASNDDLNNAKDIAESLHTAYILNKNKPYETIANAVDEIVKNNSLNVKVASLKEQTLIGEGNFLLKNLNLKATWDKKYKDEITMGTAYSENKIVSYSKWHNKLAILDSSKKDEKAKLTSNEYYLNVDGERYAVDSASGASEQEFAKALISSDNNKIYSMLTKYENESKDIGVGIYSSILASSVPSAKYAHASIGSNSYFNYPQIKDMDLSLDNTKLLAGGDDKKALLFNSNDLSSAILELNPSNRVKAVKLSQDANIAFLSVSGRKNHTLELYDLNSTNLLGAFRDDEVFSKSTNSYINDIVVKNENEIFVSFNESDKILHLDISDKSNIKVKQGFKTSSLVKNIELSKDKKYIIASLNLKQINVLAINDNLKLAKQTFDSDVNNAFSITEDKIAVSNGSSIEYYELVNGLSQEDKDNWLKEHRQ